MKRKYLARRGISFTRNGKPCRVEAGETTTDLPLRAVNWLLRREYIEEIVEDSVEESEPETEREDDKWL